MDSIYQPILAREDSQGKTCSLGNPQNDQANQYALSRTINAAEFRSHKSSIC